MKKFAGSRKKVVSLPKNNAVQVRFSLVFLSAMWLCACSADSPCCILPPTVTVHPGDLLFRRGGGLTSRAVLYADNDGLYSHVGIAVDSAGVTMVAHAVPGEPDFPGDEDRVKMERIEEFYSSLKADRGCVMRLGEAATSHEKRLQTLDISAKNDSIARKAAAKSMEIYRRRTLFDHDYDEGDTTRMYCCELVVYAYKQAGLRLIEPPFHDINLPGLRLKNVILPSDIQHSPKIMPVASF